MIQVKVVYSYPECQGISSQGDPIIYKEEWHDRINLTVGHCPNY